jgi:hypothetical protein
MPFPLVPQPRIPRGSRILKREEERARAKVTERVEKKKAKARDGRCRWPEKHRCRGGLEAAHIKDASLGGEMHHANLVTVCAWLHRQGPESIHGKQLKVACETSAGANGPLAFYRQSLDGSYDCVRREIAPFLYAKD